MLFRYVFVALIVAVRSTVYHRVKMPTTINPKASTQERTLLNELFKIYLEIEQIDSQRQDLEFDSYEAASLDLKEFKIIHTALAST